MYKVKENEAIDASTEEKIKNAARVIFVNQRQNLKMQK